MSDTTDLTDIEASIVWATANQLSLHERALLIGTALSQQSSRMFEMKLRQEFERRVKDGE